MHEGKAEISNVKLNTHGMCKQKAEMYNLKLYPHGFCRKRKSKKIYKGATTQ